MAGGASSYVGVNPNAVRLLLAVMALGLGAYIVGPPLYWHLVEALGRASSYSSCVPCNCDCSSQPLLAFPEELINFTLTDCAKRDPDVNEVMEKDFTDLLAEELKLKEALAIDAQQRADVALLEAKKLASQYQKEADKCNSGMDTCEEARERAEFMLSEQKKLTAIWEVRARQKGWKPKTRS